MKKKLAGLLALLLLFSLFSGCTLQVNMEDGTPGLELQNPESILTDGNLNLQLGENGPSLQFNIRDLLPEFPSEIPGSPQAFPDSAGEPWVPVNGNTPFFTEEEITDRSFEFYSPLDALGRCGVTMASIGRDLMPTGKRESIQEIRPTGWRQQQYDWVDGKSLYNRCHLIGFQLAGENANEKNLITGTRSMNIHGMLPFENMVADYVKETGNHVMYRVTPIFEGNNLVASGVLMEGLSVEDQGDGITFCVYAYNTEPGVTIDYTTGENWADEASNPAEDSENRYILNTGSRKFHTPSCAGAERISSKNKETYYGSRQSLIEKGYKPCGSCHP